MHQRRVGGALVAWPDPDEAVPLERRIRLDRRPDALPGHADAAAVAAHDQAVVSADDTAVVADGAERERRAAMRAEILERGDGAAFAAEQDHPVAADRPAERTGSDLVDRGGDVPGIADVHGTSSAALVRPRVAYTAALAAAPAVTSFTASYSRGTTADPEKANGYDTSQTRQPRRSP
jgi:hypothetical protein